MNFQFKHLEEWEIPLRPVEMQKTTVADITQKQAIVNGINEAIGRWRLDLSYFRGAKGARLVQLGEVCSFVGGSQPPKSDFIHEPREGYLKLVQIRDFKSDAHATFVHKDSVTKIFTETDIMIGRYGPPLFQVFRGLSGAYNVALMKAIPNEALINRDYLFYLLQSAELLAFVEANSQRSAGQSGVNTDVLVTYQIPLPPFEEQVRIVEKIRADFAIISGMKDLANEMDTKIDALTMSLWES